MHQPMHEYQEEENLACEHASTSITSIPKTMRNHSFYQPYSHYYLIQIIQQSLVIPLSIFPFQIFSIIHHSHSSKEHQWIHRKFSSQGSP